MSDLESIIRTELGDSNVLRVVQTRRTNEDDEEIVEVDVVLSKTCRLLSADEMDAVVQQAWLHQLSMEDPAFPVISFVSESDAPREFAAE